MLNKLIIGAPFGNYLAWPGVTSTLGTYTAQRRAGPGKRLWRVLTTVRYHRRIQAWLNKLGLPNPGIDALVASGQQVYDRIVSLHGFSANDWHTLVARVSFLK